MALMLVLLLLQSADAWDGAASGAAMIWSTHKVHTHGMVPDADSLQPAGTLTLPC